jgi:hypothetical protein
MKLVGWTPACHPVRMKLVRPLEFVVIALVVLFVLPVVALVVA